MALFSCVPNENNNREATNAMQIRASGLLFDSLTKLERDKSRD